MTRIFQFLTIIIIFCSCCAGHSVTLSNNSDKDRIVKIIEDGYSTRPFKNYVETNDITRKNFSRKKAERIQFTSDSVGSSYSFLLGKGQKALIQSGLGFPDMNQKIVINNSDTISLRHDRRIKVKKRIDYFYVVRISVE